MIPVPQPRRSASPDKPPPAHGASAPDAEPPGVARPRRAGGRVVLIVAIALALVLLAVAIAVAAFLGPGLDPPLIGLLFSFLFFGALSFALRFFGDAMPFIRGARWLLSFLSLAAFVGLLVLYITPAARDARGFFPDPQPRYTTQLTHDVDVVYMVTGSTPGANITMSPSGDGASSVTSSTLPFERSTRLSVSTRVPSVVTLSALTSSPAPDDAVLTCTITVDGVVIAHEESSGLQASVLCMGDVPASHQ